MVREPERPRAAWGAGGGRGSRAQSSGGCFRYSGQVPFLEAAWAPQALSRTDGVCDVRPGWGSRGRGRKNLTSTTWLACCWQGRVQIPWPGDTLGGVPAAFGRPPPPRGGCLPGGTHERTSLGPPWDWTEGHVPGSGASLPRGQATASPAEGPDPPPWAPGSHLSPGARGEPLAPWASLRGLCASVFVWSGRYGRFWPLVPSSAQSVRVPIAPRVRPPQPGLGPLGGWESPAPGPPPPLAQPRDTALRSGLTGKWSGPMWPRGIGNGRRGTLGGR